MRNVHNFRDIGGYKNAEGRLFRKGLIFRSGKLDNARKEDIDFLRSLNIKTIIDLYPQSANRRNPGKFIEGKKINIPVSIDEASKEMLRPLLKKRNAKEDIEASIDLFYTEMIQWMREPTGQILKVLLQKDSFPVLITCNMGKDRTGFAIAMIQWALGIDNETIIREYLKTNEVYIPKARRVLRIMKFLTLGYFPAANYLAAFSVKEKYVQTVFNIINKQNGGIENYLESCGVSSKDIEVLRKMLLEE